MLSYFKWHYYSYLIESHLFLIRRYCFSVTTQKGCPNWSQGFIIPIISVLSRVGVNSVMKCWWRSELFLIKTSVSSPRRDIRHSQREAAGSSLRPRDKLTELEVSANYKYWRSPQTSPELQPRMADRRPPMFIRTDLLGHWEGYNTNTNTNVLINIDINFYTSTYLYTNSNVKCNITTPTPT